MGKGIVDMNEDPDLWYIRDGTQIAGPFTRAEMNARWRRGELTWSREVSQDRLIWVSASTFGGPATEGRSRGEGPSGAPFSSANAGGRSGTVIKLGVAILAMVLGLVWVVRDGGLVSESRASQAAAMLRVLRENDSVSNLTVRAVGVKETPSAYTQAIASYLSRMRAVDTSDCPADFRVAYKHHLEAWEELQAAVGELPDSFLEGVFVGALNGLLRGELDGGMTRMLDSIKRASQEVRDSFREVENIAARSDVALP
jgi:GYF domain 2